MMRSDWSPPAIGLVLLMALGSVVMWLGVPLGLVFAASRLADSSAPTLGPYLLVFIGLPIGMAVMAKLLGWLNHVHQGYTRTADDRPAAGDLDAVDARRARRLDAARGVLDTVMIVSVGSRWRVRDLVLRLRRLLAARRLAPAALRPGWRAVRNGLLVGEGSVVGSSGTSGCAVPRLAAATPSLLRTCPPLNPHSREGVRAGAQNPAMHVIVLGIDPGVANTGYGVVAHHRGRLVALDGGVIETAAGQDAGARLAHIHERVGALIDEYTPDAVAVEDVYFGDNARSAFAVGQARGVVILAAGQRGVRCSSYTPQQVKAAVCGSGRAAKDQVQRMVQTLLMLQELPKPDHAADALAVAICHANGAPMAAALRAVS